MIDYVMNYKHQRLSYEMSNVVWAKSNHNKKKYSRVKLNEECKLNFLYRLALITIRLQIIIQNSIIFMWKYKNKK